MVEKTIQNILELGIIVEYGKELGKHIQLEDLETQYDAVFLAFGANMASKMHIPGEHLQGVYGGNQLLESGEHPNYTGKKVAIIGGGNVAMDTARTIQRKGAAEVTVIYRRAEEQMPAEKKEIADAKQEGIQFLFQTNVKAIQGIQAVEKIECVQTELLPKGGESRLSPVDIEGSNFFLPMEYVVMAVGSQTEEFVTQTLGVTLDTSGKVKIDEKKE